RCGRPGGGLAYCAPDRMPPDTNLLFHNERGARFRDASHETGIDRHPGKALGVAMGDYDDDGWPDLFVANDRWPNFLFHNLAAPGGGRRFEEVGLIHGVAYAESGNRKAGMGIDLADIHNNGRWALLVSNFNLEGLSLFHQ